MAELSHHMDDMNVLRDSVLREYIRLRREHATHERLDFGIVHMPPGGLEICECGKSHISLL
jgi:hypothetical protein